ncbi:MAG: hypothetical protein WC832_12415 [Anaerolineales bacterium]
MKKTLMSHIYLGIIILLSIIGGAIAIYTTANGPWGYSDPVDYISTAHSILHGQGVGYYEGDAEFTFTTIHPPFYSVALSVVGLTGIDLVAAARWLNIIAFIASIFIAGWIFLRFSRVPALGVIASALMCSFPHTVVMFSSSYSEPLFVLLFLLGGLCLLFYLKKEKPMLFVLSAAVLGLIPFTRYAGVAMLASGIVSVFFLASGKTWTRIKKVALFALIACLPTILWLIWVYFVGDYSVVGRGVGTDWGTLAAQFQTFRGIFMDTVWTWVPFQKPTTVLRYSVRFVLMGIGLITTIALSFLAGRRLQKNAETSDQKTDAPIFIYFGLSALAYVAVLIATYLFTLPTIDIDNRMLLPLFVGVVMGMLGVFALWQTAWFRERRRWLQALPWLVGILCVYWYVPQTQEKVELFHPGDGLTAYRWDRSETIQAVRALPADTPVISNDWELLLLWTQRPIYGFWNTFPAEVPYQTTRYGTDSADTVQSVFCSQGAALVVFNDFPTQVRERLDEWYLTQLPVLFDGLTVYGKYPDGTIYLCH